MKIMGIDPGLEGAIAVTNDQPMGIEADVSLQDIPILKVGKRRELNIGEMVKIMADEKPDAVFIEKAQTMPKQGVASSGKYMYVFGVLVGICAAFCIPYTLVHPARWKKFMMPDMQKAKDASIMRVQQMYPHIVFARKKDHHRADALLIAEYGKILAKGALGGKDKAEHSGNSEV